MERNLSSKEPRALDIPEQLIQEFEDQGAKELETPEDFELWAWYQPVHFFGQMWGIFIKESALLTLASKVYFHYKKQSINNIRPTSMASYDRNLDIQQCIYSAIMLLYLHEEYHHKVESFSIRTHIVTEPCNYKKYQHYVYSATKISQPYMCKEEALCHAYARRKLLGKLSPRIQRSISNAAQAVKDEVISQARGPYSGADRLLSNSVFQNAQSFLQSQIHEGQIHLSQPGDFTKWNNDSVLMAPLIQSREMPLYLVGDTGNSPWLPGSLQFTLSRRSVVKIIENSGYAETKGGKGSHTKFSKSGSPMIILPKGKELSQKVIKDVAKSLDISLQGLLK